MAAWALAVVLGAGVLLRYERTPGTDAFVESWPGQLPLALDERLTMVVVVHPRCPCTRTTLRQLARLLTERHPPASIYALVFRPRDAQPDWDTHDSTQLLAAIPGLQARPDVEGEMAREFGAHTSGTVLVFGPGGQRLFSGGITAGRGHEGDNDGLRALRDLLDGRARATASFPVYGCSIAAPAACTLEAQCPQ